MPRATCAYILPDGTPCRMPPLINDDYCISHSTNPHAVEKKARGSSKGGKIRAKPDTISGWVAIPITSMEDLRVALSDLLNAGMVGAVSTSRLSSLASVANALGKVIEGSELEKRIKALEERQAEQGMRE